MRKQRKAHHTKPKKRRPVSQQSTASAASIGALPLVSCLAGRDMLENGLGTAIIARSDPDGELVVGMFLVDLYCLGVKDAALRKMSHDTHRKMQEGVAEAEVLEDIKPCCLKTLVLQSVDYAASLGIAPHRDYKKAALMLADIDSTECATKYEFGREGKPFYVSGPNETPARMRQITEKLRRHLGEGGFDHLSLAGGMADAGEDDDDEPLPVDDIDDADEVEDLLTAMEAALPFRARIHADAFSRMCAETEWLRDKSPDAQVLDTVYEENLGGIMCELGFDSEKSQQPFIVSLTHLTPDENLPCHEAILRYQKRRVEALQKQGRYGQVTR